MSPMDEITEDSEWMTDKEEVIGELKRRKGTFYIEWKASALVKVSKKTLIELVNTIDGHQWCIRFTYELNSGYLVQALEAYDVNKGDDW